MQEADFQPLPGAERATSAGRPSSAMPLRYKGKRRAYLKPLPRADEMGDGMDSIAAFGEGATYGLAALVGADNADIVMCDQPERFGFLTHHPAVISVERFRRSLLMKYIDKTDLRQAGKAARTELRRRIAADYVFRCWVGDCDRNAEGYALEMIDGKLTGRISAFDAGGIIWRSP